MNTTKEDRFLDALADILFMCLAHVDYKYRTDFLELIYEGETDSGTTDETTVKESENYYQNILPQDIKEKAEGFKKEYRQDEWDNVINEIRNNITDSRNINGYVFQILRHFQNVNEHIYHVAAIADASKHDEASEYIAELERNTQLYVKLMGGEQYPKINGKCTKRDEIEVILSYFSTTYYRGFMRELDCILLQNGTNLLWYLDKQGMSQSYQRNERAIRDMIGIAADSLIKDARPQFNGTTGEEDKEDVENAHFHSTYSDEKLAEIWEKVKDYFDNNATYEAFRYISTGRGEPTDVKLNWVGYSTYLGLLVNKLYFNSDGDSMWKITEKVFLVKGNKPNTLSLKSSASRINGIEPKRRDLKQFVGLLNELLK